MRFRNQYSNEDSAGYPMNGMQPGCPGCSQMAAMPAMPVSQPGLQPAFQMPQLPATTAQMNQMALPSGYPTGPTPTPLLPSATGVPAVPISEQPPVTMQSPLYTPGFLRTQIGKRMRVEFLIGTNLLTDRTGTLRGVGASYILLQPIDSDDVIMCDIYSIKFVTIIL